MKKNIALIIGICIILAGFMLITPFFPATTALIGVFTGALWL